MIRHRAFGWSMAALLLTTLACGPTGSASPEGESPKEDRICRLLWDTYLARPGKINSSTVSAAAHIVQERAYFHGFWRELLAMLRSCPDPDEDRSDHDRFLERRCAWILGNVLQWDASARIAIERARRGEPVQWQPGPGPEPALADELIRRLSRADTKDADHLVLAAAKARLPRAADALRAVLADETPKRLHLEVAGRFYAAFGLASLGAPDGFEWLVRHVTAKRTSAYEVRSWIEGHPWDGDDLGARCRVALRALTGEEEPMTKEEWATWWESLEKPFRPRYAQLVDRWG